MEQYTVFLGLFPIFQKLYIKLSEHRIKRLRHCCLPSFLYLRGMKENKENILTIEKAFSRAKGKGEVTYIDDGILIVDDIRNIPREGSMQNRDMTIFVLCKEGHIQVTINGKTYNSNPNSLLVCSRLHVLTGAMISTDFRCSIIAITNERLQDIIHEPRQTINHWLLFTNYPLIPLSETDRELLESHRLFIEKRLTQAYHNYSQQAIHLLLNAAICEIIGICLKQQNVKKVTNFATISHASGNITQRFLILLSESNMKERSVQYYADRLCITAKYFSVVVHKETGKTPSKWIKEQLVERIRLLLVETNYSTKEICNMLDFSNPSFFCKFVKHHLGCSPLEFRNRKVKN